MFARPRTLQMLCAGLFVCVIIALIQGLELGSGNQLEQRIFFHLRLPLVLTAGLVGAALAVSSAVLQVLLKNPLADPGIIGITSGASLFAAFVLLSGHHWLTQYGHYILPLACFFGAVLSTLTIFAIARRLPGVHAAVILAGIAISTLASALVAWLHLFSDADSMRNLTFWLMGSLHQADWSVLAVSAPFMTALLVFLLLQGTRLNWFYFGSSEAQLKGINVKHFQYLLLLAAALLVGAAVAIAGSIAFVGLLVPHILRNLFGFDNRFVLPASALLGAIILLLIAMVNSSLSSFTIPVSMLTATLGGPLFLYSVLKLAGKGV